MREKYKKKAFKIEKKKSPKIKYIFLKIEKIIFYRDDVNKNGIFALWRRTMEIREYL